MALPRQVEEQLKEIEAYEKQLQTAATDPAPAVSTPAPAAQPTDPAPAPAAVTDPAPAVPAPAPAPAEEPKWEQRYKTLKGMYDADVPRLYAQVKELTDAIAQLQARPAPAPAPAPAGEKLVTDEDVQAFGEDLIAVQRKVAREVAAEFRPELDAVKAENAKLREQLGQTGAQVAEASFDQRLHRLVPDFAALNDDPRWIAWLDEVDPLLRGPRRIVAQEALNRGDAEGVAHYVDLFRKSITPAPAPDDAAAAKAAELERQIQPRRAAGNGAPAPQGKTYTSAHITDMFSRAARLSASGQHDEARKLEAEIDAAYTEGRVTQ